MITSAPASANAFAMLAILLKNGLNFTAMGIPIVAFT
jgi:hypothetical protein